MDALHDPNSEFHFLSELVLSPDSLEFSDRIADIAGQLDVPRCDSLSKLATKNHVVVRAFSRLKVVLGGTHSLSQWLSDSLKEEQLRIQLALGFLNEICTILDRHGCPAMVIKSLDHWPDLGSDLDLYTNADPADVIAVMQTHLSAKLEPRSWGDRLANKWNFVVPDLPELVEIHIGRLGQTGEQTLVTKSLSGRTRTSEIEQHSFRVLAPEDRIIISTLQRMYRHFYIRLCDVVDNAALLDSESVDFTYLRTLGREAGLWEGIATYLTIISGYVKAFRGHGVSLSAEVTDSAKFEVSNVQFRRDFLRVPIVPQSLNLYAGELKTLLLQGQVRNSFRLSLLPGLATAAALELKITGSDKGIW